MVNLKDGEPIRRQFGPEDFEDEHDTRERRATDRDNRRKAELLRVALKRFERNFDVRVSDDSRSAGQCRHCNELFIGDRSKPALLAKLLTAHTTACISIEPMWTYVVPYPAGIEEAFS